MPMDYCLTLTARPAKANVARGQPVEKGGIMTIGVSNCQLSFFMNSPEVLLL